MAASATREPGRWRAADLRGAEERPSSVDAVVRRAHRGLVAARLAESFFLACAGTLVTLAAAALSGAALARADAWAAGLVGGLALGVAWWYEHTTTAPAVARALDRRLRHQGALVTAWEVERREAPGPIAALLRERVLARLRPSEALRSLLPPLALPVAAPLLAAGALALVLDARRRPEDEGGGDLAVLGAGLATALEPTSEQALAAADAGALSSARLRTVLDLASRARRLGARLAEPDAARALADELEALDEDLGRLAAETAGDRRLARELEGARAWLDAARRSLPRAPAAAAGEAGSALAARGTEGTMPDRAGTSPSSAADRPPERSSPPPSGPRSASDALPAPPERGTAAGRWWPREDDALVAAWIEARQRAAAEQGR